MVRPTWKGWPASCTGLANTSSSFSASRAGRGRLVPAGLHDDELVAAETGGELGVRQERGDARGGRLEQLVAGGVAVQVVDLLEAVEVDDHDRQLAVARLHGGDAVLEVVLERGAVGQAGQRVEMGEIEDALLGGAALAQVADRIDAAHRAVRMRIADDDLDGDRAFVRQHLRLEAVEVRSPE